MKKTFYILIILLIVPFVVSKEYTIPLLAVKETENGFEGSTADLFLEIYAGKERVLLDTYPLTKLDTQMSTRFAKEIACSQTNVKCNDYDFIYTIKSGSVIIGGPSAGAAISVITTAALENLDIIPEITITGTINSGGLIGSVGGIKEKIDAASDTGIKTVLIPIGERIVEVDNITFADYVINVTIENKSKIDLVKYGKSIGVKVIEVATIDEAMFYITGKEIKYENKTLEIDNSYINTMKSVTKELCARTEKLKNQLENNEFIDEDLEMYDNAINLTIRSKEAFELNKYYSAASYCFGANTKFSLLVLKLKNLSNSELLRNVAEVKASITKMNEILNKKKLETITDLETYMIVKERLIEAEENINNAIKNENTTDKVLYLSYGIERLNSAISWSNFFSKGKKKFKINKDEIKKSCINKINEAEERYEYLIFLTGMEFENIKKKIDLAVNDFDNTDYELCLFKASKAKANSDIILNTLRMEEEQLKTKIEQKLSVIRNNIIKGQEKGVFPVIGYSYYEYANDLKEKDLYSAVLFAEYSLELSNLDIYFEEDKQFNFDLKKEFIIAFILIYMFGLIIGFYIGRHSKKKIKPR
jgi:uncharacterized protein